MAIQDEKANLLRKIDVFSQLREYELDVIAQYSDFSRFEKGKKIFSQKEQANELFVVAEGRIGILSLDDEDDVQIAQILPGESFGELDFLGKTVRSAGAFAEEDSILLKFPSKDYTSYEIFHKHPDISARMLYRLMARVSERIWQVNRQMFDKTQWLQELQKQLLCDKMTGLYNKVYLDEDFLNQLPDLGESAALLMIKPDNFKEINDTYGHTVGDHVLNLMAIFLQSELGEHDIGIRYRGDEFAAILMNTGKDEAITVAKEIHSSYTAMDLTRLVGSDNVKVKISIGIALYPDNADTSAKLVQVAYKKMFNARNQGGNRIAV